MKRKALPYAAAVLLHETNCIYFISRLFHQIVFSERYDLSDPEIIMSSAVPCNSRNDACALSYLNAAAVTLLYVCLLYCGLAAFNPFHCQAKVFTPISSNATIRLFRLTGAHENDIIVS